MNALEKAILSAAREAQGKYEDMTGWWLSHGPESFIEHEVAAKVSGRENFSVFPEASPKKILAEQGKKPRGRPAGNLRQRFDIVVWHKKASSRVRAVVEIKRAWATADLRGDVGKVRRILKQKLAGTGYLLVYTEAKGGPQSSSLSKSEREKRRAKILATRLRKWADNLGIKMIGHYIDRRGDGEWSWAFALFRVNPT